MADSYVCSGAMMKCTMGTAPAKLTVLPVRTVNLTGPPMANISDHKSMVNLAPFGLCRSLAFPPTAAATAAEHGHLTPMPCMHNTPAPWMGGKMDYLIKGQPALLKSCKCQCMWGGTISLVTDGQVGEGVQYVQKQPEVNHPHPQAKFIEPKTVSHIWQPVTIETKAKLDELYNQTKKPLSTAKDNVKQQYTETPNQKLADRLVLLDAYWEKDGMKIRFIPHQMNTSLIVVFKFLFNDDIKYDKSKAIFELIFDSPSTIFSQKTPIIIKGTDVRLLLDKFNKVVKDNDQPCYYYRIEHFSPDLSDINT